MLGRFTVRLSDDGSGTFGVWDGAVNGWRVTNLDRAGAEQMKTDLDLQFNAHGPRPADDIRTVDPAQPVEHLIVWEPGELDAWVRDGGQWHGRVRNRDGAVAWIPQTDLRPAAEEAP
ncbi:hypothetical protein [Kribbella sp. CA-293567]|uniref:hypothetical protein n=1 Tax=Kribbella sp. CA-293567 TaxID=3002436 RepID=UPI0022DD9020|nr:hypothetical protein [Kribbella sp. CA-293567]WBQ03864.1 hypothetical protein OX958_28325 [Kribbella sp. CA-293567]